MSNPYYRGLQGGSANMFSSSRDNSSLHNASGSVNGTNHNNHNISNSNNSNKAAIESLSLTAQSIGLTTEQLAAALAQSDNLKVLSNEGGTDNQQELALSLYRTESLALYRRCMLLAGFDAPPIEVRSPEYLNFAFQAWQEEGKRLQDMMPRDMVVAPSERQQQQQEVQQHALDQLQAQVQGKAVEAQAQALAFEQKQQQKQQQLLLQSQLQQQQQEELKSLLERSYGQQPQGYNDGLQQLITEMQFRNARNQFNFWLL